MPNTVWLNPQDVPAHLRFGYKGKRYKAEARETVTIPSDAGLWEGGSRKTYHVIRLADGASIEPVRNGASPFGSERAYVDVTLTPDIAVVSHVMFRGQDMGLTFYVHPQAIAAMLPAPAELSDDERFYLAATRSFKSGYRKQVWRSHKWTQERWDAAKASCIERGFARRNGAITTEGKNAVGDHRVDIKYAWN